MRHKAAVTGGAGVIGRELLSRLVTEGAEVLSLDREPLPQPLRSQVRHLQLDLSEGGIDELCQFQPRTLFHLAAAFERSEEESGFWLPGYRDNVLVSHRLHATLRSMPTLETYVFASSYLIYEPSLYLYSEPPAAAAVLSEQQAVAPRNLCGAAKHYSESEIRFLTEVDRLPLRTISARIFRVYGRGSRDVISRWTRALLSGEPISVYNAANRFDYIFAGDVAEGLMRLAAASEARGVVNLGTGLPRPISEVVTTLLRATGADPGLARDEIARPPFEASSADLVRLHALTGWRPTTDLASGIAAIVAHERRRAEAA